MSKSNRPWQVEEERESWEWAGVGREMVRLGNIQSELATWNAEFAGRMAGINLPSTVRAAPTRTSAAAAFTSAALAFTVANLGFCGGFLYGRGGRVTVLSGGFRRAISPAARRLPQGATV